MKSGTRSVRVLRNLARTVLVLHAGLWFTFALLSGAGEHGGGVSGLWANFPNTLPWLALFGIVYLAFRYELWGGILAVLAGGLFIASFQPWYAPILLFGVSMPPILAGMGLILCWVLSGRCSG